MNPFQVLGLLEDADLEQIKKRFRQLSLEHHPDRGGDPEKFRVYSDAYSMINSEHNLKAYKSRKNSIFHWDKDLETYFGDIFGAKASPARRTIYTDIRITMEEAFQGCTKHIYYKEVKTCRSCGGVGALSFDPQGNVKKLCDECLGEGVINQSHQTTVNVPRSVTDGYQLSASAEDVIVTVHILPHNDFIRKGFDVHSCLHVTLRDIFEGSKLKVLTMHGEIEFDLPRCIQPEKILRLKKRGFFDVRRNTYGDHLLTIKLSIPELEVQDCEKIVRCLDGIQKNRSKTN
jgi:molecular chaperone DnaJ